MRRGGVADAPAALVLMLDRLRGRAGTARRPLAALLARALPAARLAAARGGARTVARVWLLVPLVALWSNLHGGVLLGVAVAGAYLLFARLRRDPLVAVRRARRDGAGALRHAGAAQTADYYRGVIGSRAGVAWRGPLAAAVASTRRSILSSSSWPSRSLVLALRSRARVVGDRRASSASDLRLCVRAGTRSGSRSSSRFRPRGRWPARARGG